MLVMLDKIWPKWTQKVLIRWPTSPSPPPPPPNVPFWGRNLADKRLIYAINNIIYQDPPACMPMVVPGLPVKTRQAFVHSLLLCRESL
jgi:hypothetical protein